MKIFKLPTYLLLVNTTVICVVNILHNQIVNAQTSQQINQLLKAKIPPVLPKYIPKGFRLTDFHHSMGGRYASYLATYSGPNSCKVEISGAGGGWGMGDSINPVDIETSLFGKITLETSTSGRNKKPDGLIAMKLPIPISMSGNNTRVNRSLPLKGYPKAGYVFIFRCSNRLFSAQEATKILKSLYIKK